MLNKYGQIPLDIAIQESVEAGIEQKKAQENKKQQEIGEAQKEVQNAKMKAQMLIIRMQKYGPECSIKRDFEQSLIKVKQIFLENMSRV